MVAVVSPCESGWCVVGCVRHERMLVMHFLSMSMIIYCYAYIGMVVVVMHEVVVCGWYDKTLITR